MVSYQLPALGLSEQSQSQIAIYHRELCSGGSPNSWKGPQSHNENGPGFPQIFDTGYQNVLNRTTPPV